MKKVVKILGILITIIFLILLVIPLALESQVETILKNYFDKNVQANVTFSDASLSLIRSFPNAQLTIDNIQVTNYDPFKDETLATAKSIKLVMPIKEVFKSAEDEPLVIKSVALDETLLTLKTDKFGNTNYDIFKSDSKATNNNQGSFTFDIEDYAIKNSALTYLDEESGVKIYLSEVNHEGNGRFSADTSELDTHTQANISLYNDSTNYLNNNVLKLDAIIGLDLDNQVYTFKENKGYINQLPLEFQGYVIQLDNGQELDITFTNPESSFKDFLAVIPQSYAKNLEDVQTTGDFKVNGEIKGLLTDETIPTFNIEVASNNASFKYPDLPKRVENIVINSALKNTSGKADETFVQINTLNFKIDEDVFKSSATIRNLSQNMLVNADIDGKLNLANIAKVYPIEFDKELSGVLEGKLVTQFDMNALETNAYQRIKNRGNVSIEDLIFSSEDLNSPMHISNAEVSFLPGTVSLNSFNAKTGNSTLDATGTIKNLLGFVLSDNTLQGNFNVNSTNFEVNDFMTASDSTETANRALKIPEFLDCTINAKAQTVVYDNLRLKNVKGILTIKDQEASLREFDSDIFDGKLALEGTISSKEDTPKFNMLLGAKDFNIAKSFNDLELFQSLAPIATLLQGTMNTNIALTGDLNNNLKPKLTSLRGNAFIEVLTSALKPQNEKLLNLIEEKLSFIDFSKLDLNDVKTSLDFSEGNVAVKPFKLQYQDIAIEVSGKHSFDKSLDYNMTLQVPAKYLGSEVNRLIGKINDPEVNKITIPVNATIGGTLNKPTVNTNLSSSVKDLTTKLVEIQKQKLLNSGKDKIKDLLGDIAGNQETTQDSTQTTSQTTPNVVNEVKNAIGNIFNKQKKKKDSVN